MIDKSGIERINVPLINVIQTSYFPEHFPMHWHDVVELLAVRGNVDKPVRVYVDGEVYKLYENDILLIWPGELHEINDNSKSKLIGIQFSQEALGTRQDLVKYAHLFRGFHLISKDKNPVVSQTLMKHIKIMEDLKINQEEFWETRDLIQFYEMLIDFCKLSEKYDIIKDFTISPTQKGRHIIVDFCSHLNRSEDYSCDLKEAADYCGYSEYYFSRIFHQTLGMSFTSYITEKKVEKATNLLMESSLSITDIWMESGFRSSSAFNRSFKQIKNCSPSEYRAFRNDHP